jgi:tripartite-type tricarboxylate transporter receptor subunit TctC
VNKSTHWLKLAPFWLLAIAIAGTAHGQPAYPSKPVRIISDSAPGSAVDVSLRIVADGLSQHWGQQVVVMNHPGAGGAISARVAAEASPDGYTLYSPALSVFLAVPGKAPNLPLMLPRDFVPIGLTAEQPMFIGAAASLGVKNLPELIALAKQKPGAITYAVSGVGRLTHLTGELLQLKTGIKLQIVPYTGGSAHAVSDILGGRVQMLIEAYSGAAGAYQSGVLKALAVASAQRLPGFADVATVTETLPGFVATGWQVLVAPVGTAEAMVRKASDDLRAVLVKPEVKDKLAARGAYVRPTSAAEALAWVRGQQEMWKPALDQVAKQQQAR